MYNSMPLDILAGESSPKQREGYVIIIYVRIVKSDSLAVVYGALPEYMKNRTSYHTIFTPMGSSDHAP